jgi:hypothetical protein
LQINRAFPVAAVPLGDNRRRWRFRRQDEAKEITSMKSTDLEKNKGLKINGKMGAAGVPSRFAAGAASASDKREQRQQERALGQVPFACKLPMDLVKQLQERGAAHEGGMNALMTELITKALASA